MKYLILLIISFLLVSCSNPEPSKKIEKETWKLNEDAATLYQVVGEKHDTAMLLMTDIEATRSQLRLRMKTAEIDSLKKDTILNLLTALKKADDGMMNWMHEFKSTELNEEEYKKMSETDIMTYLKDEEQKIEQVHIDMLESIKDGKAFLKQ
ncbi:MULTISPECIES: hypothetical protein [unclassified Aureispira]|uniref:hypothetical protein n=1 Tax=unclassified Aureispira TaxID=2649989 RepID=UPI0006986F3B|nr:MULTISPECIES: hypothetical protein [unclassified Aureispira]WMX17314.1 hypothetical protein QP953_13115 [Aureispira sp. CCB-E]